MSKNFAGRQRFDKNGCAQITSLIGAFRDDFPGAALDPAKWSQAVGAGQSVVVAGGNLTISAGVEPLAETVVLGLMPFTVPFRVWFFYRLSQRIANQQFYLEVVNAAGDHRAYFLLDGITATSAQTDAYNAGISAGDVVGTIPTSATESILEINLMPDEAWYGARATDTTAARTLNVVRRRCIPDPNEEYFFRIRAVNLGTAPASDTQLVIGAVVAQDINELAVEVVGGNGTQALAASIPVYIVGNAAQTVTSQVINGYFADTSTPLGANANFNTTARDMGATASNYKRRFNAIAYSDQDGTLLIQMSTDNVVWVIAKIVPLVANNPAEASVPVVARWMRARYINGAIAQTVFTLNSGTEG